MMNANCYVKKISKSFSHGKAVAAALLALVLAIVPGQSRAGGFEPSRHGAANLAMGSAVTAMPGNLWAAYYNPACLQSRFPQGISPQGMSSQGMSPQGMSSPGGFLQGRPWAGAVFYTPSPLGFRELASGGATIRYGWKTGAAAASLYTSGFSLYRESSLSVSAAWQPQASVRIGLTSHYYNIAIERYGSVAVIGIDAGVLLTLGDGWTAAAAVMNLNQPKVGSVIRERLPISISIGLACRPSAKLLLVADVQRNHRYPLNARIGLEYAVADFLLLRSGAISEPGRFTAGIGIRYGGIRVNYAFLTHADLEGTHVFGIEIHPEDGLF